MNADQQVRELVVLEQRASRAAKSVVSMGGIVRVVGYVFIGIGVALGLLVLLGGLAASGSSRSSASVLGSAVGAGITLVIAGFAWGIPLVLVGGYAQMRGYTIQADDVRRRLEGGDPWAAPLTPSSSPVPPPGAAAYPVPTQGVDATAAPAAPGAEHVRFLTDVEKSRLAQVPPADPSPAWHADPLDPSRQRYWNGTEWTGRLR